MHTRTLFATLSLVAAVAACGKTDSPEAAADSVLAATPPAPKNPHIVSFDVGRQADTTGRLVGGSVDKYTGGDTLVVTIRAQFANDGDEVSVRLRKGDQTVDSMSAKLTAPDSAGFASTTLQFVPAKPWPVGTYQLETFLGTASQGSKEFTVQR